MNLKLEAANFFNALRRAAKNHRQINMNIRLIKLVDSLIGRMLVHLMPAATPGCSQREMKSILFVRPGGIGDAVLLAPAIRAFKVTFPDAVTTVLAERRNASAFSLISGVDHLFCYDRPQEFWHAISRCYDAVIDTEQWHRLSAAVARVVRAEVKIGFATNERRRMFTHQIPYYQDDYELDSFLRLLTPLCKTISESPARFLELPAGTETALPPDFVDSGYVAVFPGASIPERRWGWESFRGVAELLAERGIKVVAIGGADDQWEGEMIVSGGLGLNLAGRTSLPETAAVIARSSLLVSGDSGILHLAVGLGVPTVSLFGPGRGNKWAPQGDRHIVLNRELPCSPCTTFGTTPPCPVKARCMREISVEEVAKAALLILESDLPV